MRFVDLVTDADRGASEYILSHIRKKFPGSYSEEHKYPDRFEHELLWQLDPVDGTQEFCEKLIDGYSCLAALLKRQANGTFSSEAGIIYLPGVDKLWYTDGAGKVFYHKNGIQQQLPVYTKDALRGYQRKVDHIKNVEKLYSSIACAHDISMRIVECGGAGASIADLLEGKINIIIMNCNVSKDWDIGCAEPIVKALGGFICDLEGNDFTYNRQDAPGLDEPYNLKGYVISIAFKKEEIMPYVSSKFIDDRLKKK